MAVAFSVFVGVAVTVQFSFGLAKFGGLEYVPRVLVLSAVRVLGSGVSVAASLYALLAWTHRLDTEAIRPQLLRAAPSVVGLVAVTTPIATALAIGSGDMTSHWVYGVSWDLILASQGVLTGRDMADAALILSENLVLSCAFSWFALPLLRRRN